MRTGPFLLWAALGAASSCASPTTSVHGRETSAKAAAIVRRILPPRPCGALADRGALTGEVERLLAVGQTQLAVAMADARAAGLAALVDCLAEQHRRLAGLARAHQRGENSLDICTDAIRLMAEARRCTATAPAGANSAG